MSSVGLFPVSRPRRRLIDEDLFGGQPTSDESAAPEMGPAPSRRISNEDYAAEALATPDVDTRRLDLNSVLSRANAPSETIEAVSAPVTRRINPVDISGDMYRQRVADPNTRDAALGITESERATMSAPVPENKLVPYDAHAKRGGFLGTLKNIGRGIGLSVSQADPRLGLGGMLGAALTGGIAGGASPKALEWADYKTRRLPEFQRQQEIATRDSANREALTRRIGERTGFDPNTGKETPETKQRRMTDERLREQDRQRNEDRDEDRDLRASTARTIAEDRAYQAWLNHGNPDVAATKADAIRMGRLELEGKTPPPKQFAPKNEQITGTAEGMMKIVNGVAVPLTDDKGRPLHATDAGAAGRAQSERHFQTTQGREDRKEAQAREKEVQGLVNEFNAANKALSVADTEYGDATIEAQRQEEALANGGKLAPGTKRIDPTRLTELRARAEAARAAFSGVQERVRQHPDIEYGETESQRAVPGETGPDLETKKHAYAKSRLRPSSSVAAASGRQLGNTVTQQRYDEQVRKHGKEATDAFMAKNGLTIQ